MREPRLFHLLARAQHRLFRKVDRELIELFGVTSAQLGALFHIDANPGCRLKDLSEGLGLHNSGITTLAERLERGGLVERQTTPQDGRAVSLHLTQKGRRTVRAARPFVAAANRDLAQGFTGDELAVIVRFLSRLGEMEGDAAGAVPMATDNSVTRKAEAS